MLRNSNSSPWRPKSLGGSSKIILQLWINFTSPCLAAWHADIQVPLIRTQWRNTVLAHNVHTMLQRLLVRKLHQHRV
jgi:hypothetical protein